MVHQVKIAALLIFFAVTISSCTTIQDFFSDNQPSPYHGESHLPSAPRGAMSGSAFMKMTSSMTLEERDQTIYKELRKGNIPQFIRNPQPIHLRLQSGHKKIRATVWVLPDYLAIGNDQDFVRMPMTPIVAEKFAHEFGFSLPTKKLVDAIYEQAKIKLSPHPLAPGDAMITNAYYERHQKIIETQLSAKMHGQLIAGHKKDIVITNRHKTQPGRVAIYGWHRSVGRPIQPLSLVHGDHYADYSHGVRLVYNMIDVDNHLMKIQDVLADPKLCGLLSDEGPIADPRAALVDNNAVFFSALAKQ